MIFDKCFFDSLSEKAKASECLCINYDMRTSMDDQSQRIFNALEPGTIFPIHRHQNTSETVIVLRGAMLEDFYNDNGELAASYILKAGTDNFILQVPVGQWHTLTCLESDTILFNAKNRTYSPVSIDDILIKSLNNHKC